MSHPRLTRLVRAGVMLAGCYVLLVLAVSLTSREQVLDPGTAKRFCGLYLDCHRMAAVEEAEYRDQISDRRANGRFLVVTVRLASDAYGVTLRSGTLAAAVRDRSGRVYERDEAAEAALGAAETAIGLPNVRLPGGQALDTRIVFDVPTDIDTPALRVWDADPTARVTEFLLVGDEDSILHKRSWLALPVPGNPAPGVTTARVCGLASGCDTVVRLVRVQRESRAGTPPTGVPADGIFYLVTLTVSETDSGAPVSLPLIAEVRDAVGRSYPRAVDVETLLRGPRAHVGVMRLAFDLPDDVVAPRLVLRRPGLLNRLLDPAVLPLAAPTD